MYKACLLGLLTFPALAQDDLAPESGQIPAAPAAAAPAVLADFSGRLRSAVSGPDSALCEAYVDSLAPVTRYDGGAAGEHLGPRGYEDWAGKVFAELKTRL